ncbi:MAG: S9 family peptidase [Bryobacteraceae bacterium]|nr:S9 family peptidase [Bryobacteraceae bacterium]MDW8378320.1 S9 family peptidase [Bryobacterales bacterium]
MARLLVAILLAPLIAPAQKKPVTLEALARLPQPVSSLSVQWSSDSKRFVYREGAYLVLYDVASRSSKRLLPWSALEQAATKVASEETYAWENRRVTEQTLQWMPDGKDLLVLAGGDLFVVKTAAGGWVQLTSTPFAERDPKLSPDGKLLAYRHQHDLYVMEIASRRITRLTTDGSPTILNGELDWVYPEELDLGSAYWWSPDSQSVAYLQFDVSRQLIHPHVDLLGLFAKAEPQRYPKAGTPNADVRLGVVPAQGGSTRWMDLGETRDRLLARVYWAPDSKTLGVFRLNRVQDHLHFLRVNARTGTSELVLEEKDPYWINIKNDFAWLAKRNQFVWASERDGWRHLYLYDQSGRLVSQLTKGEFEVTHLNLVDEQGGRLILESTEASPLERQIYSVNLETGERRRLSAEPGTHSASFSPNGEYWVDHFSSLQQPPRTVLRDAAGKLLATIREMDSKPYDELEVLPTELVQFRGSDGALFYARLIKPVNFDPRRKYPAVIIVYGGPHAQTVRNVWPAVNWEQVLAHRGFVIWQMDNRGSAGRGHQWESKIYRRLGKQELEDQIEGVKHLVSLGFVDPQRIGITGWSYGGYMTLYALFHAPEIFKAGVSGAPVTDWRHYDTIYTERYLGLPSDNAAGYRQSSPVFDAPKLQGKLMLIHNFGDDNVLFQHSMQMQVELQKAGKQYELLIYPQKSHGVTGALSRHMREAMIAFFERCL